MSIWEYANPARFMRLTGRVLPWLSAMAAIALVTGLVWGWTVPDDYRQGATVRIMFIHVPAALVAVNAWIAMLVTSLVWVIRRHHVSVLVARAAAPVGAVMCALALVTGLVWGWTVPDDYRQGATVRIMFIHVPAALVAVNAWIAMLVTSLVWVIRRHHVSVLVARAAAPVGAVMCALALVTGALWGQPMWGSWWEWDPRLTSFLVLFLFYVGYMALWQAIDDPEDAADLTSVTCLVGSVFALLSRYAALFWNQGLHQGASLSVESGQRMADAYRTPLYFCMIGFTLTFLVLVLLRTRSLIRQRRLRVLEARLIAGGQGA